jgi:tetratricopeptide (TPR) repeat protein
MKKVVLLIFGLTLNALSSFAQKGPSNPNFTINTNITVQVRFKSGVTGPAGAAVTLEGEGSGVVGTAQTDSQGKASFHPPDAGYYTISVRYPGYEAALERIDLTTNPQAYVTVELKPLPGTSQPSRTTLAANVPENAAKEYRAGEKSLNEKKDADGAAKHFQKATELYGNFSQAYLMLGLIYLDQKKFDEAASALQKTTELDAKSAAAYLALGATYNQEKKFDEAEKALTRGLELNPEAVGGHYEIAKSYLAMGRWQDAEPHAQKTVALNPNMATAHVLLGNIALKKQDPDGAVKEFKEYLRLDPQGPMAGGVSQMIQKIEASQKK